MSNITNNSVFSQNTVKRLQRVRIFSDVTLFFTKIEIDMSELLFEVNLIKIGFCYLLAIMSPGPSILTIFRNSMIGKNNVGIFTAFGTVVGISMQACYVLVGVSILHKYPKVLFGLQMLCATYLIYLGLMYFISNKNEFLENKFLVLTKWNAFKQGLFVDILNPLALTFFISIFALFLPHNASVILKIICWVEIILIGSVWFIGTALFFSSSIIKNIISGNISKYVIIITNAILIILGIRLIINLIAQV